MSVKLLALAASHRADSINRRLLSVVVGLAEKAGANVTTLDYDACESPLYRGEDQAILPPGAARLADALLAHDGLILAMPEYNWSIPGALKNLIDWLSIDPRAPLNGRTGLLLCASPSTRGGIIGLQQLSIPLEHLGLWVHPKLIGIGEAETRLDAQALAPKDEQYVSSAVRDFVYATKALRGLSHA